MKVVVLILLSSLISLITSELAPSKQYNYQNWSHKNVKKPLTGLSPSGLRTGTLVIQIRSDSHVPSIVVKRGPPPSSSSHHQMIARPLRPIKLALSPQFFLKHSPLISKRPRKPSSMTKYKFITNTKPQPEYIYEKPFSPAPEIHNQPFENNIHLTNEHFGPIHTVPAPNLGTNHGFGYDTHDNHNRYEQTRSNEQNHLYNHYQVTEEQTNDQTIRDPFSGQHKYFAPDPDPSLPTAKIRPSADPFSTPSNGQSLPADVQTNFLSSSDNIVPQKLVQFINPQSDGYGYPLTNQPQLQQYLLQQASSIQGMPLSVYNPTYLVTQSNNLYNQHQQQLFKPEQNYINSIDSNNLFPATHDLSQEVASSGQILQAAQDQANHPEYNINLQGSTIHDEPAFAALIGHQNENGVRNFVDSHTIPTSIQQHDSNIQQGGFIASNYYGNDEGNYQQYVDVSQQQQQQQQQNDGTLTQANLDLQNQLLETHGVQGYSNNQNNQPEISPYEEHQRLLQEQLGSQTPLRIFVPDDEYPNQNGVLHKRSDTNTKSEEDKDNVNEASFSVSSSVEVSSSNDEKQTDD